MRCSSQGAFGEHVHLLILCQSAWSGFLGQPCCPPSTPPHSFPPTHPLCLTNLKSVRSRQLVLLTSRGVRRYAHTKRFNKSWICQSLRKRVLNLPDKSVKTSGKHQTSTAHFANRLRACLKLQCIKCNCTFDEQFVSLPKIVMH